jgi:hypothetical protein
MMTRRPLWLLTSVALATACAGTPHGSTGIGVNRVALTLAFADKALSTGPVPPSRIVKLIPAPPGLPATPAALSQYAVPNNRPAPLPSPPDPAACPPAHKGDPKPAPASPGLGAPPAEGYYRIVNSGTLKVTADGITLQFPYPAVTTLQVKDVAQSTSLPIDLGDYGTAVTTYTAVTTITPTDVVTERIQYTPSEIDLVSRSENNKGTITSETFSPPIKVYDSGGTGTKWDAVGADTGTRKVLNFQGAIDSQPVVDACGALLATYAVTSTSSLLDATNGSESGTTAGQSDVQDVATGIGGLFAHQELHRTQVTQVNGAAVTVETNVKSTLDGHAPSATPPPIAAPR